MRHLAWMAAILLAAAAGGIASGPLFWPAAEAQQAAKPKVVQAERFEVVDSTGKVRASISVNPNGSVELSMADKAGKVRALLCTDENDMPQLSLLGSSGQPAVHLALSKDGTPTLSLRDRNGGVRAALSVTQGGPRLHFYDKSLKTRMAMMIDAQEAVGLYLFDSKGVIHAGATVNDDGSPIFKLVDKKGKIIFEEK